MHPKLRVDVHPVDLHREIVNLPTFVYAPMAAPERVLKVVFSKNSPFIPESMFDQLSNTSYYFNELLQIRLSDLVEIKYK